jgi:hypothetical protein
LDYPTYWQQLWRNHIRIGPGSFNFRMGVADGGGKEQKGFVPHGVLLARHAPYAPKPFAQVSPHDITSLSVT